MVEDMSLFHSVVKKEDDTTSSTTLASAPDDADDFDDQSHFVVAQGKERIHDHVCSRIWPDYVQKNN